MASSYICLFLFSPSLSLSLPHSTFIPLSLPLTFSLSFLLCLSDSVCLCFCVSLLPCSQVCVYAEDWVPNTAQQQYLNLIVTQTNLIVRHTERQIDGQRNRLMLVHSACTVLMS